MRIHAAVATAVLLTSAPATPTPPSTPMSMIRDLYLPLQGCRVEMSRTGPLREPPPPTGPAAHAALGTIVPAADRAWPEMSGDPMPWGRVPIQDVGPDASPRLAPRSKGYDHLPLTAAHLILRTPETPQAVLVRTHGVEADGGTRIVALRTEGPAPDDNPTYTVTHRCPESAGRTFPAPTAVIGTIWSDRELPDDFPRRLGACTGLANGCEAALPKGRVLLHYPYAEGYHAPDVGTQRMQATSLWLDMERISDELRTDRERWEARQAAKR